MGPGRGGAGAGQFRFVFLELQQDFHGCVGRPGLTESLIRSTKLIELEAQVTPTRDPSHAIRVTRAASSHLSHTIRGL